MISRDRVRHSGVNDLAIMVRIILLALSSITWLSAQTIQRYELRQPPGALEGSLIVIVKDRELRISNKAIRVWPGWAATKLLYAQPATMNSAFEKVQSGEGQELRIYDAPSTTSSTLTVEKGAITAVTHVLLGPGEVGFVISTLDTDRVPWVVLANNKVGVYRRIRLASPGPITGDSVELRHFDLEDLTRANGEIAKIPPSRTSRVRLLRGEVSPIGNWVGNLPAASAPSRNITLTLYPGGMARLVLQFADKPEIVRSGAWSQAESDLILDFIPVDDQMRWELKANELVPKDWNRQQYGSVGLPLKRSSAPWAAQ